MNIECTNCKELKDTTEFRKRKQLKRGYQSWCRKCESKAAKLRYKPKPKKKTESQPPDIIAEKAKIRMLKWRYNLSFDEYEAIYEAQNHRCKICNTEKPLGTCGGLVVDHCHKTDKVRGLLCGNCNSSLGKFKDDINILQSAINYLNEQEEAQNIFA